MILLTRYKGSLRRVVISKDLLQEMKYMASAFHIPPFHFSKKVHSRVGIQESYISPERII